jgi:hypothetical protein
MSWIKLTFFLFASHNIVTLELIDELLVRGIRVIQFPSTRPYSWEEVTKKLNKITPNSQVSSWLIERLKERQYKAQGKSFSVSGIKDTITSVSIVPSFWLSHNKFRIWVEPLFKIGDDGLYPKCYLKDKVGFDYNTGYLSYNSQFCALLGRDRLSWGPSIRSNLLLSERRNPFFDMLSFSYFKSFWKYSLFFTRLNDMYGDSIEFVGDTLITKGRMTRFLTGHRIEFKWKDLLSLGLSEVALSPSLELYYLTPVFAYLPYEVNLRPNIDHNFIGLVDMRLFLPNFSIYAEFLVDDIQYAKDKVGCREPDHLGLNIGLEVADILKIKRTFFQLEYTGMTRWVFTHSKIWHRYLYRDHPIGHPLGPDFDEIYGKILYHFNQSLDIYLSTSFIRHGEGRIDSKWPIHYPPQEGDEYPKNNFLSGIIEKRIIITSGINLFRTHSMSVYLDLEYTLIWNYNHIKEKEAQFFGLNIGIEVYK